MDDPQVWYEGSTTTSPRFLHADERGSIVAVSNSTGSVTDINTYDTWGVPAPGNAGRFQYTGQIWLPQLSLYQYKARMYAPHIGRFMQTDPIGYEDGMNMYAYVGNDPVNGRDPEGTQTVWEMQREEIEFDRSLQGLSPHEQSDAIMDRANDLLTAMVVAGAVVVDVLNGPTPDVGAAAAGAALGRSVAREGTEQGVRQGARETPRAARRQAMREAGIPTSQQPVRQGRNASGRFQEYDVPRSGGGTERRAVVENRLDRSHPGQRHFEAGRVRTDSGRPIYNRYGAPRLANDKCKIVC